jgi:flavodoxin I
MIGAWKTDGYKFQSSKAVIDNRFVGLALDQENQKDLTPERLENWLKMLAATWD